MSEFSSLKKLLHETHSETTQEIETVSTIQNTPTITTSSPRLYVNKGAGSNRYGIFDNNQIYLVWGTVGSPLFVRGNHWTMTVNFLLQRETISDVVETLAEYTENLEDEQLQEDLQFIINFLLKING